MRPRLVTVVAIESSGGYLSERSERGEQNSRCDRCERCCHYERCKQAIDTPECIVQAAHEIRERLLTHCGLQQGDGFQGKMVEAVATAVDNPDTEAARWLSQEAAPLDVEAPIASGGLSPKADPSLAADE